MPGLVLAAFLLATPAAAQTPQQQREFCQRIAVAAGRCALTGGLNLDTMALAACLVRSLGPQDSLRVAMAANSARGNVAGLLSECGLAR